VSVMIQYMINIARYLYWKHARTPSRCGLEVYEVRSLPTELRRVWVLVGARQPRITRVPGPRAQSIDPEGETTTAVSDSVPHP